MIKPDRIEKVKEGRRTYLLVYSRGMVLKVRYSKEYWPSVKAMVKDFEKGWPGDA